jgi:hypothetical protein
VKSFFCAFGFWSALALTCASAAAESPLPAAAGGTASDRAADIINVKDFGATGNGIADDTVAIQSAVSRAEARMSKDDYWSQSGLPYVYFPPGRYLVSGIDILRGERFGGDGPSSVLFVLKAGSNRSAIRVLPQPRSDPAPWAQVEQPLLSGFSIDGNASNQSGASHGLEFSDAPYSLGERYGVGARISDINIRGTRNHGIYIGKNRNLGFLDRAIVQYANNSCVYFVGVNDWEISNSSLGACGWNGIDLYYSGQITITATAVYNNKNDAVHVGEGFGGYLFITGSTIGAGGEHGLSVSQSTLDRNAGGVIGLSNVQVTDNSLTKNNHSSHFYVRNFNGLMLSNVQVFQKAPNNAKFIIDNDSSSFVHTNGLFYAGASGRAPYATAAFANPATVVGPPNESEPAVSCNGPPSADFKVTSGRVTHC